MCEPTYKVEELRKEGIDVTDLVFDDGTFPPTEIVERWFDLLRRRWILFTYIFLFDTTRIDSIICNRFGADPSSCVAVHCVAGLGRAPVLVALALIELGMKYEDAVELIREYVYSKTKSLDWLLLIDFCLHWKETSRCHQFQTVGVSGKVSTKIASQVSKWARQKWLLHSVIRKHRLL